MPDRLIRCIFQRKYTMLSQFLWGKWNLLVSRIHYYCRKWHWHCNQTHLYIWGRMEEWNVSDSSVGVIYCYKNATYLVIRFIYIDVHIEMIPIFKLEPFQYFFVKWIWHTNWSHYMFFVLTFTGQQWQLQLPIPGSLGSTKQCSRCLWG